MGGSTSTTLYILLHAFICLLFCFGKLTPSIEVKIYKETGKSMEKNEKAKYFFYYLNVQSWKELYGMN